MTCGGYGTVTQLPAACNDTRIIFNLVIRRGTTVNTLQHRILEGLQARHLELAGLGIRAITESAFDAIFRHLQVLHLQDNQLDTLPLGVFHTLSFLGQLQLHNNRLTRLSDGLFAGLNNLKSLTLNVNRISAVDPGTWYALPSLVTLILEDNRLGEGRLVFPDRAMMQLEELRLDKNQLVAINDDIIAGFPKLRRLYFRWNLVEALQRNVFRTVAELKEVYLTGNNISKLTQESFNGECMTTVTETNE